MILKSSAITECATNSAETFNVKINNLAEGVLLTIDAFIAIPFFKETSHVVYDCCEFTDSMARDRYQV